MKHFSQYTLSLLLAVVALTTTTWAFAPPHVARSMSFAKPPTFQSLPEQQPQQQLLQRQQQERTTTTSLAASSPGGFAFAAITGAITGGFFAGSLHAIAGPDHLAALLPRCCGQRWYRAVRVGALWGMGHGVSATILGVTAFALKNTLGTGAKKWLTGVSHLTEIAVGLSLILIGVMGILEAREWEEEIQPQSLSAAAAPVASGRNTQKRAVILNGLLHGFSWDGAPSLAPAIAVATWSGNLAFLSAYAAGTMTAMAIATTLIGEGTRKAGEFMNRPDLPQKLSFVSSMIAIAIGGIWCGLALI